MTSRRQIKGKDFINDLRSGMTPADLIKKYSLSTEGLRRIFRILVDASAMKKVEIDQLSNLYEVAEETSGIRRYPRKHIDFPLLVYDNVDQIETGSVIDVSEKGVRIRGLNTKVGDVRTFIVRFGPPNKGQPFVFEAICRWVDEEDDPKKSVAGFEITSISSIDAKALHNLVLA